LDGAYHKLLHLLSTRYLTQGNWPEAIQCLERLRSCLAETQTIQREQDIVKDQEVVHGLLMMCYTLTSRLDLALPVYDAYVQWHHAEATAGLPSSTLEKLSKIIQTYRTSNLRARAVVVEALQRISRRTMEPRLEDALLSIYMATGAQHVPSPGPRYRAILLRAQEEARQYGAVLIGTPHLILALCEITMSDFPDIQNNLGLSLESLSLALSTVLREGSISSHEPTKYTHTLPLQRVLQVATDVAGAAQANTVDIPHLWLALLKEEYGILSQLFEQYGIDRLHVLEQMEEELA
jgi:hypothetical protein